MTGFIIDMFYFLTGIEGKNIYGEDGLFLVARFPKTVRLFFLIIFARSLALSEFSFDSLHYKLASQSLFFWYNYDYYDVFQRNTRITLRLLISSFSATR